ncbi:MAG: hypothetical protein WDW38_001576 [Sanguina aurantia]
MMMMMFTAQSHQASIPIKASQASDQAKLDRRDHFSAPHQQSQAPLVQLCLDRAALRRGRSASSAIPQTTQPTPIQPFPTQTFSTLFPPTQPLPAPTPPTQSLPTLSQPEPTHTHSDSTLASSACSEPSASASRCLERSSSVSSTSSTSSSLSSQTLSSCSSLAGRRSFSRSLHLSVRISTEAGTGLLPGPLFPPAKLVTAPQAVLGSPEAATDLCSGPASEATPVPSPPRSTKTQPPQIPPAVGKKELSWEHQTLYGVHVVSGGWFSKCRGCGQLTASEHETAAARECVPFCGECVQQLRHLPDMDRAAAELQMLNIHRGWGHLGV